jgi:hypothetical protein
MGIHNPNSHYLVVTHIPYTHHIPLDIYTPMAKKKYIWIGLQGAFSMMLWG